MLNALKKMMGSTMYVQIWENRLKITNIDTGAIFDEEPVLAIKKTNKGQPTITAFGNKASSEIAEDIEHVNPFSHPRSLIADFTAGEKLIQHIFKVLFDGSLFNPSPLAVIHPMEKTEGGLTQVEQRAFMELGAGAGARDVAVYQGPELDIHEFDFVAIKASCDTAT